MRIIELSTLSPVSTQRGGNTIPLSEFCHHCQSIVIDVNSVNPCSLRSQDSRSKNWFFTLNNYTDEDYDTMEEVLKDKGAIAYCFQQERGKEGTPHIQGCFRTKNVSRFTTVKAWYKWHIEMCHDWAAAVKYCSKVESREFPALNAKSYGLEGVGKPEVYTFKLAAPYPWQQKVIDIINGPVDDRKIYWFYCKKGGSGKTALAKHLCMNNGAIFVSGKGADVKAAIAATEKKPKVVVFGIPRTAEKADGDQCISWDALESVKDGMFFSGKYESGMVLMPPPHMIVFANFAPDTTKLSADRWVVENVGDEEAFEDKSHLYAEEG